MVSALMFFALSSWSPAASAEDGLTRPGFEFSCDKPESLLALKALYLCQSKMDFSACGSLAGYVADRPLTQEAIQEAKKLIQAAATAKLEMPQESGAISSMKAMEKGTFSLDPEDLLFMAIPAVGWGGAAVKAVSKAAQQVGMKMVTPGACSGRAEFYVNSDSAHRCVAHPNSINKSTFEFFNSPAENQKEGMSIPAVCDHYKKRLEALIRRTSYSDLQCGSGELTSVVRKGDKEIRRRLYYDGSGSLSKVEFRFAPDTSKYITVYFQKDAPISYRAGADERNEDAGVRTLTAPMRALRVKDPVYSELSRLKTEKNEFVACCQQQDPRLRQQCSGQLGGAKPGHADAPLVGESIK